MHADAIAGLATSATAQATVERFLLWQMREEIVQPFKCVAASLKPNHKALHPNPTDPCRGGSHVFTSWTCCWLGCAISAALWPLYSCLLRSKLHMLQKLGGVHNTQLCNLVCSNTALLAHARCIFLCSETAGQVPARISLPFCSAAQTRRSDAFPVFMLHSETAGQVFARISALRDRLDGPQFDDQGIVNTDDRFIAGAKNKQKSARKHGLGFLVHGSVVFWRKLLVSPTCDQCGQTIECVPSRHCTESM